MRRASLKLLRSSSPEIFDNSARAWLIPNSNYDLMCMKMQFLALVEMAEALGHADEAKRWRDTAAALGDFHTDANGMLLVDAKTPLPDSHRHLSNLMGLYPFNLITCEGGEQDRQRIRASLAQWDQLGTEAWCGYSFSWMSALRARVGDAEAALRHLDIFVKAFILRNGFHVNGDQTTVRFLQLHLPAVHARRQLRRAPSRPRNAAAKLESHARPARHGDHPHLPGHAVALA